MVPNGQEEKAFEQARIEIGLLDVSASGHSDYRIMAWERDNPVTGVGTWESRGHLLGHNRNQTVWALVERAAAWAKKRAEEQG
jgi:hypothetical protein